MMSLPPPSVLLPASLDIKKHGHPGPLWSGPMLHFPFTLLHCSRSRPSWRMRAHSEDILAGGVFDSLLNRFPDVPTNGRERWSEQSYRGFLPNRRSDTKHSTSTASRSDSLQAFL